MRLSPIAGYGVYSGMCQGAKLYSDGRAKKCNERTSVFNRTQLVIFSSFAVFLLAGCPVSAPEKGSEAITLVARYNQQGRHDDAIKVALRLNQRPRKTLGFQTPASKLQESVASTG